MASAAPNFVVWPEDKEKMDSIESLLPAKVFVYGSLKRGFHNHSRLMGSKFIGEAHTEKASFQMHDLGGFPAVTLEGQSKIIGEVFEVTEKRAMISLDMLESHPRWYQRILIPTSLGTTWMYIMPASKLGPPKPPVIPSGFWSKNRSD